jgi:hypothetical protein
MALAHSTGQIFSHQSSCSKMKSSSQSSSTGASRTSPSLSSYRGEKMPPSFTVLERSFGKIT